MKLKIYEVKKAIRIIMNKKLILSLLLMAVITVTKAQSLRGQLKQHAGQTISLRGFDYYQNYDLATSTIDSLGNFILAYPNNYKGMGVLQTQDNSSLILSLTEPLIQLQGTHLKERDGLEIKAGAQNMELMTFAQNQILYQQAYKAWRFLQPLYNDQQAFQMQAKVLYTVNEEIQRIEEAGKNAKDKFPEDSYLHWFLSKRQLVNDMPATVYNYTERLPINIQAFRAINFSNPKFKTSGLFKELIEGHYMLLENMGQSLDSVYTEMNISTDYLIQSLNENESLLNTVSEELFNYFEKRSLFTVAAHLSNQMLDNQCELNTSLANTMEKYRRLKVGNIAPDLQLDANTTLSSIKKPVLLVFGASWCPHCETDSEKLLSYYESWKTDKNVEVVYMSIDTDVEAYKKAYQNKPWKTYCDYKGWETQAAKDYFVNATPTYVLLDKDLKILLHPRSLEHADVWIKHKI